MTQPAGWYEDPQDSSQLRYWDGVVWSSHATPKVSPTVGQSNIGMPYGVTPAASRPPAPGSKGAQGSPQSPGSYQPPGQAQPGPQDQGQHGGQGPAYGQTPGPPGPAPLGWTSNSPTTPDGVVLSGWGRRALAQIIDFILVLVVTAPLTFAPARRVAIDFGDFVERTMASGTGGTAEAQRDAERVATELLGPLLQITLVLLAVWLVYEVVLLATSGATLGHKIMRISVRLRDKPGPAPLLAVMKRTVVKGCGLFWFVPVLGIIVLVPLNILSVLWPLWDDKKQAIHDKVGTTNVVVGPQPGRKA